MSMITWSNPGCIVRDNCWIDWGARMELGRKPFRQKFYLQNESYGTIGDSIES